MLPNLLHPVPVKIQQLDKAGTIMDDDYREPVQQSTRGEVIEVPGQVKWGMKDSVEVSRDGKRHVASGYVLFRYVDLGKVGVELKTDDILVEIGGLTTDVYLIKFVPCGHYPEHKGPTMVKAYFADRQPTR